MIIVRPTHRTVPIQTRMISSIISAYHAMMIVAGKLLATTPTHRDTEWANKTSLPSGCRGMTCHETMAAGLQTEETRRRWNGPCGASGRKLILRMQS